MSEKQVQTKTRPFSIRLTEAERAFIETNAGATPLPEYVREILLGEYVAVRRARQTPVKDREPLARTLAALGKSNLGDSLSRLARLAETGALYCDPETLAGLRRASDDIRAMRVMLMQALGKEADPDTSDAFNDSAGRVRQ